MRKFEPDQLFFVLILSVVIVALFVFRGVY